MEKTKWLLSGFFGMIATFFQHHGILVVLVLVSICFDVATGLIKAKINGEISSQKGTRGFFKKISLLVCLFFGFFLDIAIPYMFGYIGMELPFSTPFGMIICFYIVLNECISICENLYACNESIMPKWVVKILLSAKEKIEDINDENVTEKQD